MLRKVSARSDSRESVRLNSKASSWDFAVEDDSVPTGNSA